MGDQKMLQEKLSELSSNLWWSWQPEVTNIFREIDPVRWSALAHNPIQLLEEISPDDLPQAWIKRMKRAVRTLGWRFSADRRSWTTSATTTFPPPAACRAT